MQKVFQSILFFFMLVAISVSAYAYNTNKESVSLGSVANNLMVPINVFSSFINTACFLLGGSFLFASLVKFLEYRRSPLMVSISTVIFLLIAGAVLILLPFLSLLTGRMN